ncbi:MAG: hypothetical protein AB7P99_10540 [Vicinamibacterales bacterium]
MSAPALPGHVRQATAFELARRITTARLMRRPRLTPVEALTILEDGGYLAPRCPACRYLCLDAIAVAERLASDPTWRPATSHAPSPDCVRDGAPHCPCGVCTERPSAARRVV